jgi:hypothetical protein
MSILEVVRYHVWDSAWTPDGLAGKTIAEVGHRHEHLLKLTSNELKSNFAQYNQRALDAVRDLTGLDQIVHLTYGDFPAREYLQHNVSIRAFWSYDIARVIGADFAMADDFVHALVDEFSPVVEDYRMMGHFPPEVEAPSSASPKRNCSPWWAEINSAKLSDNRTNVVAHRVGIPPGALGRYCIPSGVTSPACPASEGPTLWPAATARSSRFSTTG